MLQSLEYLLCCSQTLLEFGDLQTIFGILQNQALLEPVLKEHLNQTGKLLSGQVLVKLISINKSLQCLEMPEPVESVIWGSDFIAMY